MRDCDWVRMGNVRDYSARSPSRSTPRSHRLAERFHAGAIFSARHYCVLGVDGGFKSFVTTVIYAF